MRGYLSNFVLGLRLIENPKFCNRANCVGRNPINLTISSHPMPRIFEKRRLENELASTMEGATLDSGPRKWKTTICLAR